MDPKSLGDDDQKKRALVTLLKSHLLTDLCLLCIDYFRLQPHLFESTGPWFDKKTCISADGRSFYPVTPGIGGFAVGKYTFGETPLLHWTIRYQKQSNPEPIIHIGIIHKSGSVNLAPVLTIRKMSIYARVGDRCLVRKIETNVSNIFDFDNSSDTVRESPQRVLKFMLDTARQQVNLIVDGIVITKPLWTASELKLDSFCDWTIYVSCNNFRGSFELCGSDLDIL
jgi:hypothetical protein